MNKIFYIMGRSGTGKDTMYNLLMQNIMNGNFSSYGIDNLLPLVMKTTRPKRKGEIDGVTYDFVDKDKLEKDKEEDKIISLTSFFTVNGNWDYYTSKDSIKIDKFSYIGIGTPKSYKDLESIYTDHMFPILLTVETDLLFPRLVEREKQQLKRNWKELCRRFLADEKDFSTEEISTLIPMEKLTTVKNDNMFDTYNFLFNIIKEELKN